MKIVPKKIIYYNGITKDSFSNTALDNTFCFFKSIEDILFLIYSNKEKSIITYNLIANKIIKEIKKAHDKYITNIRHYLDLINKKDLVMSISRHNNNIKIWNFKEWNLISDIKQIYDFGSLDSACFLNNNNDLYILTSNSIQNEKEESGPIKIYNLEGKKISELTELNFRTYFIDTYYDNKLSKNYIITGNSGYSLSTIIMEKIFIINILMLKKIIKAIIVLLLILMKK